MNRLIVVLLGVAVFQTARAQAGDPKLTEKWDPVPSIVKPGEGTAAPSDATVLFDGSDLSQWERVRGGDARWVVQDGIITVVPKSGDIRTRQSFGDVQLHIEWRTPSVVEGEGQGRGNSGVFFQGLYEVQILDSFENVTYSNGQAGSIYKQHIPLVNASRPPGLWQSYDIIYEAPLFTADGDLIRPAIITVIHNGILIINRKKLTGPMKYIGNPEYSPHGRLPLMLQDHGNPVSYRNIWIREL